MEGNSLPVDGNGHDRVGLQASETSWRGPFLGALLLLVERPAPRGLQPDTDPSQLWFAVKRGLHVEPRREAESKKAPLEGIWV